ncbi:MlaD family protein [Rhodococcus aetherivorans]|uniref:MlaD family protein n=1 Tax=Rhodococcus aetherivorans TaxID=191292 RepID=UPI0002D23B3C|nr:MlaD family protein [Rhodococcus aetherivorans]CCW11341.1 putative Mce family protein [Rhodococcus aetherivorans]
MSRKLELTGTLIKLGVAAVVSVMLFVIIINAIKSPVEGDTHIYTADFTDVSGLHVNGDVRAKGVQIGKVLSVDLRREGGETIAKVAFSLKEPYQLTDNTVLAVKYQNLTGARFLDLEAPAQPGGTTDHLTTAQTRPSFDITELFNGLQPVLTTMSTDEINTFTQNAITLLQGDGGGLAPMLDSVQKLADVAHDREQVISALVANLSRISDALGGRSPQVVDFLHAMSVPVGRAMTVLDEFTKTAQFGPNFTRPLQKLIVSLGITEDLDVDQLLAQSFSSMPEAAEALRLLPVAFAGLQLPQLTQQPGAMGCSNGVAQLPTEVKVLLNGSEVVVCNAK